jgi:hypothetical protein
MAGTTTCSACNDIQFDYFFSAFVPTLRVSYTSTSTGRTDCPIITVRLASYMQVMVAIAPVLIVGISVLFTQFPISNFIYAVIPAADVASSWLYVFTSDFANLEIFTAATVFLVLEFLLIYVILWFGILFGDSFQLRVKCQKHYEEYFEKCWSKSPALDAFEYSYEHVGKNYIFSRWDDPFKVIVDLIVQLFWIVTTILFGVCSIVQLILLFVIVAVIYGIPILIGNSFVTLISSLAVYFRFLGFSNSSSSDEVDFRRNFQHYSGLLQLIFQTFPQLIILITNTSRLHQWTAYGKASAAFSGLFMFQKAWFYGYYLLHDIKIRDLPTLTDSIAEYEEKYFSSFWSKCRSTCNEKFSFCGRRWKFYDERFLDKNNII